MSDRNPFDINGWIEQKVQEQQAPVIDWLLRLRRKVDEEIHRLRRHHHHHHPHQIVLLQPTLTTLEGEPIMAAYPLKTNVVAHFVLVLTNPAGGLDPVDPTDVFTVTSSDPTNMEAVVGTNASGQTEIAVRWLHKTNPPLTGIGISISDSAGNTADNAETFDMVPPAFVPDQIGIDTAGVTETPQPDAV